MKALTFDEWKELGYAQSLASEMSTVHHLHMSETPAIKRFGRRRIMEIIEALRPLGLNATLSEFALAVAPLCKGRFEISINAKMVERIILENRHQQLINSIIMTGCKRYGYETTYKDLYPVYLKACKVHRIQPVSLKTFKNRALQRETRWERTLKRVSG